MKHLFTTAISLLFCVFTMAQSPCDSIIVHSVAYDIFHSDSLVEVVIKNESSLQVNYPALLLLNSAGDTVASEDVNFFVLTNYYQGHSLAMHAGPSNNMVSGGQLMLTSYNDTVVCAWENDYDLCRDTCSPIRITMQGATFPSDSHSYTYDVMDSNANILAHDTMHIDSTQYASNDTVCLLPGNYSIVWKRLFSETVQPLQFRMDAFYTFLGPLSNDDSETVTIPFDVMAACLESDTADSTSGVPAGIAHNQFQFGCNDECILIQNNGANRILSVHVYDLQGRLINQSTSSDNFQKIPVRNQGVYVVRVQTEQGVVSRKVLKY